MSPLSASPTGTARAAVLGSTTSCGTRLRQMLAEFGVPGSRVDLYAAVDSAEPILSEYKGEARLVQKPDLDELLSRDVVFLCETGKFVEGVADRVASVTAAIDVANARKAGLQATLVHMDVNPKAAGAPRGLFAVPHDLSTLANICRRIAVRKLPVR